MSTKDFIAGLPKVELHRHLEGSIRPEVAFNLAQKNMVDLGVGTVDELAASYVFGDFGSFIDIFLKTTSVLLHGEDLFSITAAMAEEMVVQNVLYAEIIFAPIFMKLNGMAEAEISEGLNAGRNHAAKLGLELAWIADIPRHLNEDVWHWTVDYLLGPDTPDGAIALGLGGPEVGFGPEPFEEVFAKARAGGLGSIPHGGETMGAASVRGAVEALGATRIGHGVRCLEDAELVRKLIENDIALDVSITSNVLLGVADSYEEHPLPRLIDAGLTVTLNTDDPGLFRTDLNQELQLAHDVFSFDPEQLRGFQLNAVHHALCSDSKKRQIRAAIEAF